MIEAATLGNFIQPLVPYMAHHSEPSIDVALGTRTRKEVKDRGRWKSDRSRYEQRAQLHKSLHPPAGIVSRPTPEVRERAPRGDLLLHSDREPTVRFGSVTSFLPRRPRGAYFVVLSIAACKVGRRIRQRGFLVGWYDLTLDPADLRRLRSDALSVRILGAVLSPSCASWTSCRFLPNLSNVLKCLGTTASPQHPNGKPAD